MFNRGWSSTYTRNKSKTIEQSSKGFVVYFDGVGKSSLLDTYAAHNVKRYVNRNLTNWKVITDLMPYSPLNLPLTQVRMSSSLWLFFKGISDSAVMIFRNVIQTLTMHDSRYKHDYTQALSEHTIERLMHSGYQPNDAQPIVLIGYSGGAGVATLIASTLMEKLGTKKLTVITIGG
uniref:hypothetical protein n=1 Tax=Thaumasiovibrio occultus TaxID=1891184 RepID=UPI00192D0723